MRDKRGREKGKLYGVSLGPGDPGLITMRAHELLKREKSIWAWPVKKKGADSFALDIARRAGLQPPEGSMALIFPMTHDRERLEKHWQRAARMVAEKLSEGQDVMFLVEGDASTFSTFGHLARALQKLDPQAGIETIAGVSSFNAAAARLDFSLAEVDDKLAVFPANYGIEAIDHLLDEFDRLALMKVRPMMDEIIELLERRNLLEHAAFIERAGCPDERIVHDVASLRGKKVGYLSLLLIHNPHRQKERLLPGCRPHRQRRGKQEAAQ